MYFRTSILWMLQLYSQWPSLSIAIVQTDLQKWWKNSFFWRKTYLTNSLKIQRCLKIIQNDYSKSYQIILNSVLQSITGVWNFFTANTKVSITCTNNIRAIFRKSISKKYFPSNNSKYWFNETTEILCWFSSDIRRNQPLYILKMKDLITIVHQL